MNETRIYIDSFSGSAAELHPSQRTPGHVLQTLTRDPRVSTFDLSELRWLAGCIYTLTQAEYINSAPSEPYPWHRYTITDKGREQLGTLA